MIHPILLFGDREARPIPTVKPFSPGNRVHLPGIENQNQRLSPQFQRLAEGFNRHNALVQQGIQGLEPESVIVFEVAESVDRFITAVKKAGMEWMGDWDSFDDPDEDFFIDEERCKKIPEKLYFTMSDQRALEQMLSLWNRHRAEERLPRGFGAFSLVFQQLRNVRLWDAHDRFSETGVSSVWEEALRNNKDSIQFELELWYRDSEIKRAQAQDIVSQIVESYGGRIVNASIYPEIAYHGLVVDCPSEGIRALMDNHNNPLFNANQIMWIRATGQAFSETHHSEVEETALLNDPLPTEPPVIALLDGLPLAGHVYLKDRVDIHDNDGFESRYPANLREHGTEMASIILYGDLNHPLPSLKSLLYVRPIMRPNGTNKETVPEDRLFVDLLHQSVMEIVNDSALVSSIRIINLSIGDTMRPFSYVMSPAAKMLDYLGERYNLLFIVSSGNETSVIDLPMTLGEYNQLSIINKYKVVYEYLWNHQADMRILAPAESVNSLTVGAISIDCTHPSPAPYVYDIIPQGSVATYSRYGGGFNRSIKPDLLNRGGRLFYSSFGTSLSDARFRPTNAKIGQGPGIKTAVPSGGLTGEAFSCGTSHATALTSRMSADLLDALRNIPGLVLPSEFEAVAVKAMLIHCCSWSNMDLDLQNFLPSYLSQKRKEALKWIGYGLPYPELSMSCTDQRVTLFGFGRLNPGFQEDLLFPIPQCLNSQRVRKRLTITLAWMSPIAANRKNYRSAKLFFRATQNPLMDNTNQDSDSNTSRRGTVQHEVYEDCAAHAFQVNDSIAITVTCRKEPLIRSSVKYVIMATLEVAEESQYPIYEEVAVRLQNPIQVGI